jgi:DNA-binding response OmpR family regulator
MEIPAIPGDPLTTSTLDLDELPSLVPSEQPVTIDASISVVPVSNAIILVIDDDPTVGTMIQRLMAEGEAYVVTATTGAEGLRLATDLVPDLIVLDLKLPDLHGLEVLARLRDNPELTNIPIVVLTIDEQSRRSITFPISEYLVKPVALETLLEVVKRYCRPQATSAADHILLVEDDQRLAELLERTLRAAGWSVEVTFDGEAGLAAALTRPPGLILLDYMLPKLDGLQFLAQLRADPVGQTIPVILMTARDLSNAERQQLAASADAIQYKAELDIETLITHIRTMLTHARSTSADRTVSG